MTYEPDWTNSRTKKPLLKRLVTVLEWCKYTLDDQQYVPIHNDKLAEIFGIHSNPFSAWLMSKLLIKSQSYSKGKVSKGYKLNTEGYAELELLVPDDNHLRTTLQEFEKNPYVKKHKEELDALEFTYTESSNRLWHPLQFIKRARKQEFWAPYLPYDYDVEACAPTIIVQMAYTAGMKPRFAEAIDNYLKNKDQFRARMMELTGLSYSDTKRLINSLFNGAKLIPHFECAAYELFGRDEEKLAAFAEDREIICLRGAINRCWKFIEEAYKMKLRSGSAKWAVYFKAERSILDVVIEELRKQGIKFFTEHDGFRTNVPVDQAHLLKVIKDRTGFELKLSSQTFTPQIVNPAKSVTNHKLLRITKQIVNPVTKRINQIQEKNNKFIHS